MSKLLWKVLQEVRECRTPPLPQPPAAAAAGGRAGGMSWIEQECRWTIAGAFLDWSLARHATFAWLAYCHAIGLWFGHAPAAEGGPGG
jgi:hypothetical protein